MVIGRDKKRIDNRRTRNILDVLTETPDMGESSGHLFMEDSFTDYALDGNTLVLPSWRMNGDLMGLKRYRSTDAQAYYIPSGALMYRMMPIEFEAGVSVVAAARDVIHARFPRMVQYSQTATTREHFAIAPVVQLRSAISAGLKGDTAVDRGFNSGNRIHIDIKTPEGRPAYTQEQKKADCRRGARCARPQGACYHVRRYQHTD